MIHSRHRLTTSQMVVAKCSERSITNIRKNMRLFGSVRSPPVPAGRLAIITPVMLDVLCNHLAKNLASSNMLFPRLAGQKGKPSRRRKSRTLDYEISTSIKYPEFRSYHLVLLMNLDVINVWDGIYLLQYCTSRSITPRYKVTDLRILRPIEFGKGNRY
ncbi:hypothetical protein N7519_007509 [Penicillium mononematosum]|uniref:uncharacterized protein n=1 Tax=Penicillium mononematosum TaxID=268346 RepID=UPI002547D62B|nr:uncharacterized protein N7519_007509 [Penicillium mononematosum]KAJ6186208.1 hypothetical protein N7519_007509 [Penicillium mononematosum]